MTRLLILIPAAGQSSRMRGQDKLLLPVDAVPLLVRQIRRARTTGQDVLVTLPRDRPQRRAALAGTDGAFLADIDGTEGMSASLRHAATHATGGEYDGLMILLPDMPDIDADDLRAVIQAFDRAPDHVVRAATSDGRPGHPAILPKRLFTALRDLRGDTGARPVLQGEETQLVRLPGDRALADLDTPEDWAAWIAARS